MRDISAVTRVNRVDLGDFGRFDDLCRDGAECLLGDVAATLVVLVLTGVASAVVVLTLVNVRDAAAAVREERERAADERDAFAAFARRVAAQDPVASGRPTRRDGGPLLAAERDSSRSPVPEVESAYRATVMSVGHYDEEYGKTLSTHLAAEFGADVARAVRDAERLTPQLQSVLVSNARTASDLRDDLVGTIDEEADAVAEAERTLTDLDDRLVSMADRPITDRSYDELLATWRRLDGLDAECGDFLAERQATIRDGSFVGRPRGDAPDSIQAYLYEPLSVTYPVLVDGARVAERIRTARRRVFAALVVGPGLGTRP